MNDTPRRKINEVLEIHPLVAVWLTKNGYSYIHEYTMPDFGRVDFYATHSDGHTLLVEVKGDELSKVITQIAGYGVQIPNARLAIAAPQSIITDKIRNVASKYNVMVIELDYAPSNDSKDSRKLAFAEICAFYRLDLVESFAKNPQEIITEILESNLPPISKILNFWFIRELVYSYSDAIEKEPNT